MKKDLQELLQKEMDRREFLRHVGLFFVVVSGAPAIIKALSSFGGNSSKYAKQAAGYGSGAYGGYRVSQAAAKTSIAKPAAKTASKPVTIKVKYA